MDILDLKECKDDRPNFRKQVNDHEDAVLALESSVKALIKLSKASVDLAEEYSAKQLQIADEMNIIAMSQRGQDTIVSQSVEVFVRSIHDLERNRSMMNTQISQMFIEPLEIFLRQEVIPVKEARKPFQKASDDVDMALHRYMSRRPRDQAIPEASKDVADSRKKFHHEYVEYCMKLNDLQAKEKFEFMEYIVTYMYTISSFFHRGYDVLSNAEDSMSAITENLQQVRTRFMEDKLIAKAVKDETLNIGNEAYYPIRPFGPTSDVLQSGTTTKSGYLFKKGSQRVLPTWSRRYFEIEGELLTYATRGKMSKSDDDPALVINLRVCTVKIIENGERPHLFEVISPMRVHVLQAENTEDMKEWVYCLQNAITAAHNSDQAPEVRGFGANKPHNDTLPFMSQNGSPNLNGNTDHDKQLLLQVRKIPGNEKCADCQSLSPMWASVNHGSVLCIECSGIHRSLGVHVSKVRSLNLDKWDTETVGIMLELGNTKTNQILEAKILNGKEDRWISVTSERAEKERFIVAKYIKKEFMLQDETNVKEFLAMSVHETFWRAMDESNLCEALRCLALGANIDYKHEDFEQTTALHRAIIRKDDVAVEFLFQWFCDINAVDAQGWSGLHHAIANDNTKVLGLLIRKHAKYDVMDKNDQTPLQVAKKLEKSESLIVLQIYQFEQQQNEQSRPSSAQSGNLSGVTSHFPVGNGVVSSSAPLSAPASFTEGISSPFERSGSPSSASLHTLSSSSGQQLPPLMRSASSTPTLPAATLPTKPNLASRNSTGTTKPVGNGSNTDSTGTKFAVPSKRLSAADAKSLAAIGVSTTVWADEKAKAVTTSSSTTSTSIAESNQEEEREGERSALENSDQATSSDPTGESNEKQQE